VKVIQEIVKAEGQAVLNGLSVTAKDILATYPDAIKLVNRESMFRRRLKVHVYPGVFSEHSLALN